MHFDIVPREVFLEETVERTYDITRMLCEIVARLGEGPPMSCKKLIIAVLLSWATASCVFAQTGKEFSIPMSDLKTWADKPVAELQVKIAGHSAVHPAKNDCEMHLGGHVATYQGDPDGWVLEPMNACQEPLPGTKTYTKAAWLHFGDLLKGKTVDVTGIVRIWPEHLTSSGASNPAHALELHPLLTATKRNRYRGQLSAE